MRTKSYNSSNWPVQFSTDHRHPSTQKIEMKLTRPNTQLTLVCVSVSVSVCLWVGVGVGVGVGVYQCIRVNVIELQSHGCAKKKE